MNRFTQIFTGLLFALIVSACSTSSQKKDVDEKTADNNRPNIVYILADDLGYGDLSCYGQKKFSTPHIDKMAAEGMLFTQHYAGCTVCAPSRCALMTGLHTGHTFVRGNKEVQPEGQLPIPDETFTVAELLKNAGYVTGAFGKWGLGFPGSEGDPLNQGFDEFFGYNCQRLAHNYYPAYLWDNNQKVMLEGNTGDAFGDYAPELIHKRALQFIEKNKNKPFFLYYPTTIPHAELLIPEENLKAFRGKYLPEKQYKGAEPGDRGFRNGSYGTQPESHAAFAAMVTLLDKQVGEVLDKIKELGLEKNTLVIFTSDNGPHLEGGADPDYFDSNGPLKGYKRDVYEGGIREPMIAWWPGKISEGTTNDHISAFWDMMPTFADLAGAETPADIDGISMLPTLTGKSGQKEHEYLYWEFHEQGGRKALRKGNWKLVQNNVLSPGKTTTELYDLSTDIGEENNVAEQYPGIVSELLSIMNKARTESDIFSFQ